jgi:hypothetical protein
MAEKLIEPVGPVLSVEPAGIAAAGPTFDPDLGVNGGWFAVTLVGLEVYGDTDRECKERLRGANGAALDHAARDLEEEFGEVPADPMGLDCAFGPCCRCPALMRGKCDWKGHEDAGD